MKQTNLLSVAVVILGVLLIVTASTAYMVFLVARQFYTNENTVRLDPYGLSAYPTIPIRLSPDIKRVVFLGDSRAASWTTPINLSGWEFINRGIGGQTTAQVLGRFAAQIVPLQPQVIVLQVGINDLRTIPIFPDSRAAIVANCLANIQSIIEQSNDLGAVVILTPIFPVTNPTIERRFFFWSDDIAQAVVEVNKVLHQLVKDRVILLDADLILLDGNRLAHPEYMEDTLHLNSAAYTALNLRLSQLLLALP